MTSRDTAKRWGCSVSKVTQYCREGLVPLANKPKRKAWEIPDNSPMPPLSRRGLCVLLDNLIQIQSGASLDLNAFGYNESVLKKAYDFLSDLGFIKKFNKSTPLDVALINTEITPRGQKLIEDNLNENKKVDSKTTLKGHIGATIGVANAGFSAEIKL